jgi:hypothetical protein
MKKYAVVLITSFMAVIGFAFWAWASAQLMPEVVHTAASIEAAERSFRLAPWLSRALLVAGAAVTAIAWRKHRGATFRTVSAVPLLALVAGVFVAPNTMIEATMFSPVEEARFVRAADADFLQPPHLVLGVAVGTEAKAYPIGMLAYHHIVNDRLAGEAYVATY